MLLRREVLYLQIAIALALFNLRLLAPTSTFSRVTLKIALAFLTALHPGLSARTLTAAETSYHQADSTRSQSPQNEILIIIGDDIIKTKTRLGDYDWSTVLDDPCLDARRMSDSNVIALTSAYLKRAIIGNNLTKSPDSWPLFTRQSNLDSESSSISVRGIRLGASESLIQAKFVLDTIETTYFSKQRISTQISNEKKLSYIFIVADSKILAILDVLLAHSSLVGHNVPVMVLNTQTFSSLLQKSNAIANRPSTAQVNKEYFINTQEDVISKRTYRDDTLVFNLS